MIKDKKRICDLFIISAMSFVLIFFAETNIKYAEDYLATDYVKAKKIALSANTPTDEMIEKYDIDNNGEVTCIDVEIIKQMICGYYDCCMIKNGECMAIKYIVEWKEF